MLPDGVDATDAAPQGPPGANPASATMAARDRAAGLLGYEVLAVEAGRAVVAMTIREDMLNGLDVCHGGLIFTLADSAMAHASNSHGPSAFAVTASIEFLSPGRAGDQLHAEAVENYRRGRTAVYDVTVRDGDGAVIALFRGRTLSNAAAEGAGAPGVPEPGSTS